MPDSLLLLLTLWCLQFHSVQFSRSVMSDSATPWTAARQASLSTDALRVFVMFCPQWELWSQLPSPPVYLLPQPLLSSPATTTQPQAYQRWLAVPQVTLLCRDPTLEGSEKLSCVPVSCSWWDGTDSGCQARIWTRLFDLGCRSYPHMALPPRSPEDKRCHTGGTQYCILIEKSAQSHLTLPGVKMPVERHIQQW